MKGTLLESEVRRTPLSPEREKKEKRKKKPQAEKPNIKTNLVTFYIFSVNFINI